MRYIILTPIDSNKHKVLCNVDDITEVDDITDIYSEHRYRKIYYRRGEHTCVCESFDDIVKMINTVNSIK